MKHQWFFTLLGFLFPLTVFAAPLPRATIGAFDFTYLGEYFTSEANLSEESGDTDDLPFDQSFRSFSNLFEIGYGLRPGFRLSAGGVFSHAQSNGVLLDRTNSEFSTVILSGQYFWGTKKFRFVPNFRAHIALETIEDARDNDDVFTSEGESRYEFGAWLRYPIWKLDSYFYAAYLFQEENKADLLLWSLGTTWPFQSFNLRAHINGATTLVNDGETRLVRKAPADQVNGGSFRFNAYNPEYIEADFLFEFKVDETKRFGGGFGHTLTGKNFGYGPSIFLTFTAEFGLGEEGIEGAYRLDGSGQFQPELEDYDESLFQ